jgi:hypothetical protein
MVNLDGDTSVLLHSRFNGRLWTTPVPIPNQASRDTPALAEFDGLLHMVRLGSQTNQLFHSTFDGTTWSRAVRLNESSSRQPALAVLGNRLHMVFKGNRSKNLNHARFDGRRWTRARVIRGQTTRDSPSLAEKDDKLHLVHLGRNSNNIWQSQLVGTRWTPEVQVPARSSRDAPSLVPLGSRLFLAHVGSSTNNLFFASGDGSIPVVTLGIKILLHPRRFTIDTMVANMRTVYASRGILVDEVARQDLTAPELETVDVGRCVMSRTTDEQDLLFRKRAGLQPTDVAVYFVRGTVPAFNGCAAHADGVPACVVTSGASSWTLGHEVGHVLRLRHVDDHDRLMTGRGTDRITNEPPDLIDQEEQRMIASPFSIE